MSIFNKDFYPTPAHVISEMVDCEDMFGKNVLEPSAGKGDIVDYLQSLGANVIACEKSHDLKKIVGSKCLVIADDFLTVTSDMVSHLDYIVMNPPFSADEHHILHAYNIAPAGCKVIALCNLNTVSGMYYSKSKLELTTIIKSYGSYVNLGNCFTQAERETDVNIALVRLQKPSTNYNEEFEGFFTEQDPEEEQYIGLMPHNHIRELVSRYTSAIKLYDEQLSIGVQMNNLIGTFTNSEITFQCKEGEVVVKRNDFVKSLQKAAWQHVFGKMNMKKYATKGLKEDINLFVEKQHHIPFTMRNVYRMLEIVIGTHGQRMDKAIIEVFDKLTERYHENRYNVEGWKTNSYYLFNQKFILPYICNLDWGGKTVSIEWHRHYGELLQDLIKAMCWLTAEPYQDVVVDGNVINKGMELPENGYRNLQSNTWYDWGFFEFKVYKKGTGHFRFKNLEHWALLNQNVARIKGYPLFEHKPTK